MPAAGRSPTRGTPSTTAARTPAWSRRSRPTPRPGTGCRGLAALHRARVLARCGPAG
jgi:hypothetical protein